MGPNFGTDTKGVDVVQAFPENVQKKTCKPKTLDHNFYQPS